MSVVEAKDWVFIICTIITLIVGILNFYLFRRQSLYDREHERRKSHEESFAKGYNDAKDSFDSLTKSVRNMKRKKISDVSQYDVFLHMFHNKEIFSRLDTEYDKRHGSANDNRFCCKWDKFKNNVKTVMMLFTSFRFKFPDMENEKCSKKFKREFQTEIDKFGKIIYPFCGKKEQQTISRVMKYFGIAVESGKVCNHSLALLQELEKCIEEETIDEATKMKLETRTANILQCGWSDFNGNLLCLVRIVIYHILVDFRRLNQNELFEYVEYVKDLVATARRAAHNDVTKDVTVTVEYTPEDSSRLLEELK